MSKTSNDQQKSESQAKDSNTTIEVPKAQAQQAGRQLVSSPAEDLLSTLKKYAHDKPDVAAMWCFGIGLILGWKLRR